MSGYSSALASRGLGQGFDQNTQLIDTLDQTLSQVQQSILSFVRQQVEKARSYKNQLQQYRGAFSQLQGDSRLSSSLRSTISNLVSNIDSEISRANSFISGNTDAAGNPVTGYEGGLSGPRSGLGQANAFEPNQGLLDELEQTMQQIQQELSQSGSSGGGSNGGGSNGGNGSNGSTVVSTTGESTQTTQQAGFDVSQLGTLTPVLLAGGVLLLAGQMFTLQSQKDHS